MKVSRRTFLAAGLAGVAWIATQGLAKPQPTFVFHVSTGQNWLADWVVERSYGAITSELEKRGFRSMLVHSSVKGSDTPNQDRAAAVVKALQDVTGDVVLVGVSNEGNFLPLVAAARPIRRLVYVNACIPRPGQAFIEACQTEQVTVPGSYLDRLVKQSQGITDDFLKLVHDPNATAAQRKAMQERIDASRSAHVMVGFYEVCPLKALPHVENVCVSGSADDQIRRGSRRPRAGCWASSRWSFPAPAMRTSSPVMRRRWRTPASGAFDGAQLVEPDPDDLAHQVERQRAIVGELDRALAVHEAGQILLDRRHALAGGVEADVAPEDAEVDQVLAPQVDRREAVADDVLAGRCFLPDHGAQGLETAADFGIGDRGDVFVDD